jgi:multidrug efflux pump subunit AcrB
MYTLFKFGVLIQFTIAISIIYALVFFPAINYLLGPQKNNGDLNHWVWMPLKRKVSAYLKKKFPSEN